MRYREVKPEDLERTRDVVRGWRAASPQGTPEQLFAGVGGQSRPDWAPVLRSVLITAGRRAARKDAGIITGPAGAAR